MAVIKTLTTLAKVIPALFKCRKTLHERGKYLGVFLCLFATAPALSAVLPEDRSDALYHRYEGGGVTVDGPSVLVRKQLANKVSLWGNYYVDMISSASIDVISQGSPYSEERTETSAGFDYLHDRTTMSFSYTRSDESDYEASTFGLGVSQDFFGDLTTLTLGYSRGDDIVMRNGDEALPEEEQFSEDAQHKRFSIGLTQVLTKSWIMAFSAETVVDEGYLNNPYRQIRYLDASGNLAWAQEKYPTTRNSDAFALRSMYYLPYRASLRFEIRKFADSWGIKANNYELRYIHPHKDKLVFELKYRAYSQGQADFYSDLFPYEDALEFLARDKEMSEFTSTTIGIGVNYEFEVGFLTSLFDKTTAHLYWDNIAFDYANFREYRPNQNHAVGNEPFYRFNANVIRLFVSAWY